MTILETTRGTRLCATSSMNGRCARSHRNRCSPSCRTPRPAARCVTIDALGFSRRPSGRRTEAGQRNARANAGDAQGGRVKEEKIEATKLAMPSPVSPSKADIIKHLEANRVKVKASYKKHDHHRCASCAGVLPRQPIPQNVMRWRLRSSMQSATTGIANEGSRGGQVAILLLDPLTRHTGRRCCICRRLRVHSLNEEFAQIANAQGDRAQTAGGAMRLAIQNISLLGVAGANS